MDQSSAPIPVVEAPASISHPTEVVDNAMNVVTEEEPPKIRLSKAEKRALAESKRKDQWKAKVRSISNSTPSITCKRLIFI